MAVGKVNDSYTVFYEILLLMLLLHPDRSLCWDNYNECRLFSKLIHDRVVAMTLLPDVHPFKIEKKRCVRANPLIVGGRNATDGEFPHMLAVGYKQGANIEWLCGGSLISRKFALTSAHCAQTKWGAPDIVHIGTLRVGSRPHMHTHINVESAVVHPDYNPPKVYYDIALLKLAKDVVFDRNLRPACLSPINDLSLLPSPVVTATGWGHTTFGGLPSSTLLKVSLKIIGNEECQKHYQLEKHLPNGIDDTMFCAVGYNQTFDDTCQGDSGGPLQTIVDENECLQQVIGITSFGKYCGSGLPAIYIKVAAFLPWIKSVVQ